MDINKAIDDMNNKTIAMKIADIYPYSLDTILEAAKKQIPEEPKADSTLPSITSFKCPDCGNIVGFAKCDGEVLKLYKFCDKCGKALLWQK